MAHLYAPTGDGIARVDEVGEAWTAELFLSGSAAQCVAVDPNDPDVVYAGLRQGRGRRSIDGGKAWFDCGLPSRQCSRSRSVAPTEQCTPGQNRAGCSGELWKSRDRGASWARLHLEGDGLDAVLALAHART